ncbi:ribonuclease h1 h2 small subunit protein [Cystoisospora suis]|uniref:Ribonuclease h1 h2 small subunit protein n=1 Tax=Cystoisospora suis TaxID=483139 RepID=A0A2C6KFD3_9APIC|nr:ribonuclease h1 h2 small subunit protein [Cystoisospora suis]
MTGSFEKSTDDREKSPSLSSARSSAYPVHPPALFADTWWDTAACPRPGKPQADCGPAGENKAVFGEVPTESRAAESPFKGSLAATLLGEDARRVAHEGGGHFTVPAGPTRATGFWRAAATAWQKGCRSPLTRSSSLASSSCPYPCSHVFSGVRQLPPDDVLGGTATVHLLPCKISFTGDGSVRKYFRPHRAYGTPAEDAGQHTTSCDATERVQTPASVGTGEDHVRIVSPLVASPRSSFQGPARDRGEATGGLGHVEEQLCRPVACDTVREPTVVEALLHGRLMRGLCIPLTRNESDCNTSTGPRLKTNQPVEETHEEHGDSGRKENLLLSLAGGCRGFVVTVAKRKNAQEVEVVEEGEEMKQKEKRGRQQHVVQRQREADKEVIPLGALSHLCYWQQDALPSPTDDVLQLLAFMRLASAVHDWSDDFPTLE